MVACFHFLAKHDFSTCPLFKWQPHEVDLGKLVHLAWGESKQVRPSQEEHRSALQIVSEPPQTNPKQAKENDEVNSPTYSPLCTIIQTNVTKATTSAPLNALPRIDPAILSLT